MDTERVLVNIVCILLSLSGIGAISSIGLIQFSFNPIYIANFVFGLLMLASAFGLYKAKLWGFYLGVAVLIVSSITGFFDILAGFDVLSVTAMVIRLAILVFIYYLFRKGFFAK